MGLFKISWNDIAAVGVNASAVPIPLLLLARRYALSALTCGAVWEKA